MSRRARRARSGTVTQFAIVALIACIVLYYALAQQVRWQPYLIWLAACSITGFAFYGWDKMQSQRGGWRVPELVLHGLALAGGVAGCWLGMLLFRHKTQHGDFVLVLIVATIIHGAVAQALLR